MPPLRFLLAGLFVAALAVPSRANLVYEFSGTIDQVDTFTSVSVGDTFSATLSFPTSSAGLGFSPTGGNRLISLEYSFQVGSGPGYSGTITNGPIGVQNSDPGDNADQVDFIFFSSPAPDLEGQTNVNTRINFDDGSTANEGATLDGTETVQEVFMALTDLTQWSTAEIAFEFDGGSVFGFLSGNITSFRRAAIPEPATASVFSLATLLIGASARRRR